MAPFYGWVQLPQGYSHFEEAVYFLPFNIVTFEFKVSKFVKMKS